MVCICLTMYKVEGCQAGAIVAGVPMSTPAVQRDTASIFAPGGSKSHLQKATCKLPGTTHTVRQHSTYIIPVGACCSCLGSPDALVPMHAIALQAAREMVRLVCSRSGAGLFQLKADYNAALHSSHASLKVYSNYARFFRT